MKQSGTLRGVLWSIMSRYGSQAINFVALIVVARYLTAEEVGVVGYGLAIIGIMEVLRGFGVGSALVYLNTRLHGDAALTIGLAIASGLCVALWLSADYIAHVVRDDRVALVLATFAIAIPISATKLVHEAFLIQDLKFRLIAGIRFVGAAAKALVTIFMVVTGFGLWGMVWGQLAGGVVTAVMFWRKEPWRPRFPPVVEKKGIRELLIIGGGYVGVNSIAAVTTNIDYLIVGYFLGTASVGVYLIGFRIPDLLVGKLLSAVAHVLFPTYVQAADDDADLGRAWLDATKYLTFVVVPIGLGLVAVSEPLVEVALGERWLESAAVVAMIALRSTVISLTFACGIVMKARGLLRLLNLIAVLALALTVIATIVACTFFGSLAAVAASLVLVRLMLLPIQVSLTLKLLGFRWSTYLATVRLPLIFGLVMFGAVSATAVVTDAAAAPVDLAVRVTVGAVVYVMCFWFFAPDERRESLQKLSQLRR